MIKGQVMIDLNSIQLLDEDIKRLQQPGCGGVIFFSRNYQNQQQLTQLIKDCREVAEKPILIAVDHEGGPVQRFRDGFSRIPSMASLGELYENDSDKALVYARALGWLMAAELRALDIDFSFAPVLDRRLGISTVIGDRAFHLEPDVIIDLAIAWMKGMHGAGMATTGKHFPGHGAVEADSHIRLPVDERHFEEISATDLLPFKALINHGIDAIMPAHILFSNIDASLVGFSEFWLGQVLRQQLAFDGVIFSDDLSMEATAATGSYSDRARAAFAARCDMVLICNNPKGADEVLNRFPAADSLSCSRLSKMQGRDNLDPTELRETTEWRKAARIADELCLKEGLTQ